MWPRLAEGKGKSRSSCGLLCLSGTHVPAAAMVHPARCELVKGLDPGYMSFLLLYPVTNLCTQLQTWIRSIFHGKCMNHCKPRKMTLKFSNDLLFATPPPKQTNKPIQFLRKSFSCEFTNSFPISPIPITSSNCVSGKHNPPIITKVYYPGH